jgi:uncharacterized phage protein (TIGR02216 family)
MEGGLGTLRLPPPVFWAMTPREFEAALRGAFGVSHGPRPMSRADLAVLMSVYPDEERRGGNE